MLCVGFFWLFWILMIVVAALAIFNGDPLRLIRPIDFEGNVCDDSREGKVKTAGKPSLFYPQLPEDALALAQAADLSCLGKPQGCFTGICVKACPKLGEIVCDYAKEAELAATAATEKWTAGQLLHQRTSLASRSSLLGKKQCWFAAMPQKDLLLRCLPWSNKIEAKKYTCIEFYQNESMAEAQEERFELDTKDKNDGQIELMLQACSGTVEVMTESTQRVQGGSDQLSGTLSGIISAVETVFRDLEQSWWVILAFGPIASGVLSFGFIIFMMYFASIIIWSIVFACFFVLLACSIVLTYKAGELTPILNSVSTATGVNLTEANARLANSVAAATDSAAEFAAQYSVSGADGSTATSTGTTGTTKEDYFRWGSYVAYVLTVFALLAPCLLHKQIRLSISLIKEAASTLQRMKLLLLYPFFSYFWIFVLFVYFLAIVPYIISADVTWEQIGGVVAVVGQSVQSRGNESFSLAQMKTLATTAVAATQNISQSDVQTMDFNEWQGNTLQIAMLATHAFGYIWTTEFIKAIGMCTIAGAVALDYWVDMEDEHNKPQWVTASSFYRAVRYHSGTAIFGALIVAIVRVVRYIMMYIDSKTSELQKTQKIVMILMKVVHCCLWCLEKCVRFITQSAYIMCAIEGTGFCLSAWRAFKLLFTNSLRVATTQVMCVILLTLAQAGITLACVLGTAWSLGSLPQFQPDGDKYVDSAVAPAILTGVSAFFVTNCFMGVYQMAIMTLLLSFCLDEDKFKNGKYAKKLNSHGEVDKRMFCFVNKKTELYKLTTNQAQKVMELQAMEEAKRDELWGGERQLPVTEEAADSKGLGANADGDVAESVEEHLDGWSESDSLQPLV